MLAGFSKVDITPPLSIPYLSYAPRQTPFEGVHDPLYARAMVLAEDGPCLAVLACDSLGFSNDVLGPGRDFTAEVREKVARRTGIAPERLMLATNHVHSTPQTANLAPLLDFPEAGPWLETLIEQLVSAVALAYRAMRPAVLRAGVGSAPGIARNRRTGIAASTPVDDSLVALRVDGEGWRGCLLNFACHPVTVQVNPLVSADYPGAACSLIERVLDADSCLLLQGACGDLNPVRDTTDFEDVERYGMMLGGQALSLLARLSAPGIPAQGRVFSACSSCIELPPYPYPPAGPLAAEVERLRARLAEAEAPASRDEIARELRVAEDRLRVATAPAAPVPVEMQAFRIGEVAIVSMAGEPFCDLGLEIRRRSPAPITLISAYTNGYQGYFPTDAAYAEGGYETSVGPWCRVGPGASGLLVDGAVALLEELWSG